MKIDAHQHFWKYDPVRDGWITAEMQVLQRNFLPGDILTTLQAAGIDGCVAVQADQSEAENEFLLSLAEQHSFIKGVVGWVDLRAKDIEDRLAHYAKLKLLKGFRHVLQGEADRALMLRPEFMHGISLLSRFNFTYDILILHDQLQFVPQLAAAFPAQPFVIDHMAKPLVKQHEIAEWAKSIYEVAKHPNVHCKISGLVTEADWQLWQPADLLPYFDVVWEAFGAKRVMFGSDHPVCLLAATYQRWVDVVESYTCKLSADEQAAFRGNNAVAFYNL